MATEPLVNIRKMKVEDVEVVQKIEVESFPDTPWTKETYFHELFQNQFAHYFVLTVDDIVIGYIGLWIVIDDGQITTLAIKNGERGKGYASRLMDYVIDYVKPSVKQLSLEVNVNNENAIYLYEKKGFLYGGLRKDYYGKNQDAHVMWVRLDGRKY